MKRGVKTLLFTLAAAFLFGSLLLFANNGISISGLQTANQPPTPLSSLVTASENPTLVTLNDYFFDADGDALTFLVDDPAVLIDRQTLAFVPPPDFFGDYTITLTVSDGTHTIAKPFTLAVPGEPETSTPPADAPFATLPPASEQPLRGTLETATLPEQPAALQEQEESPTRGTSEITVSAACGASITACCDITSSGTYTLANDITNGTTCISVSASNVDLDCDTFTITYDTDGTSTSGVPNVGVAVFSANNVRVRNCSISDGNPSGDNAYGISLSGSNISSLENNTIRTNGVNHNYALYLLSSHGNNITQSTLRPSGSGTDNQGLLAQLSENTTISTNDIETNGTHNNYGFKISVGQNNTAEDNIILAKGTAATNYGIWLESSPANTIRNNSIATNGTNTNLGINIDGSDRTTAERNVIRTNGSGGVNHGIFMTSADSNLIQHNSIYTNGTSDNNFGMDMTTTSLNNTVYNNTIHADGGATGNFGLRIQTNSNNSRIYNNTITTNGTTGNTGVAVDSAHNLSIENNTIFMRASGNGISLASASANTLRNNSAIGLSGIILSGSSSNTIANNFANGTSLSGLEVASSSNLNTIENNTFVSDAGFAVRLNSANNNYLFNNNMTSASVGIRFDAASHSVVANSTIVGTSGQGAHFQTGTNNTVANSTITTTGSASTVVINADNNRVTGNAIYAGATGTGINIDTASELSLANNTVLSGGVGLDLSTLQNSTLTNNTISVNEDAALSFDVNSENNTFDATVINANVTWLSLDSTSSGNNISNTTFNNTQNGSILSIDLSTIPVSTTVNTSKLSIRNNTAFLNSTNLSFLNTSAQITLYGITFTDPRPRVDFEDDGSFANCDPPQCTEISYAGGTYVFNVSSFTTYISAENVTECGTITADTVLTNNVSSAGTCFNITANNAALDCAGYTITYANSASGVGIDGSGRTNVTVRNCIIEQASTNESGDEALLFLSSTDAVIVNNTVRSVFHSLRMGGSGANISDNNFTSNGTGVETLFLSSASSFTVTNNTLRATGNTGKGLDATLVSNSVFANNTANATFIALDFLVSTFNLIENNTARADNLGLRLASGADDNNASHNLGIGGLSGGIMINTANRNLLYNNTGVASGSAVAVRVTTTTNNTLINTTAYTLAGTAVQMDDASGTSLYNTTAITDTGNAMSISGTAENNTINSTLIISNNTWLFSGSTTTNNTFTSTNFSEPGNASVFFPNFTLSPNQAVNSLTLNLMQNDVFLNSTNHTFLNGSAQIRLESVTAQQAQSIVDFEDDGSFTPCVSPDCTFISYAGGILLFNVSHFTSFSSTQGGVNATLEKTDNPDPLNLDTQTLLNYTINFTVAEGAAFNVTINETYPADVNFVTSDPAPTTGNFSWDAGNLSVNSSYLINITVNVSPFLPNGTVINNTVNATYFNSSGDTLFINVTENTTILNDPCPLNITTNYTLTGSLNCTQTAVLISASNLAFDCAGNTINHSATQAGFGVNISGFRTNVTVKNCIIRQTNGSLNGVGINAEFSNNNDLSNNTISGGASSAGIGFSASGFSRVSNSTITTRTGIATSASGILGHNINITNVSITGLDGHGISLTSDNNLVDNVTVMMTSPGAPLAIFLQVGADNNTINNSDLSSTYNSLQISSGENNTADNITANSTALIAGQYNSILRSNFPLGDVQLNGNHNLVYNSSSFSATSAAFAISSGTNNTIANVTGFTTSGIAIAIPNPSPDGKIVNSSGTATSGHGGSASLSSGLTIANNTFRSISGLGFELANVNYTNFTNNTLLTSTGIALRLTSQSHGNIINNTRISTNDTWIGTEEFIGNNTLENTLFNESANGGIFIATAVVVLPNVTADHNRLNVTNNRAFLNSSNLSFLNTTAQITLENIAFTDPRPRVDFEDDGTFINCDPPQCTEVSYAGTTYVFNVSSFTTYTTSETPACPGTITTSWQLNGSVESNATCVTFGANNLELDCRGNTINYSATTAGNGVLATGRSNVTVRNCNIYLTNTSLGSSSAILYTNTDDSAVINTTTNASASLSAGIEIAGTSARNTITNSSFNSTGYPAVFLFSVDNMTVTNVSGISTISIGINSFAGGNHTLANITARGGTNAGIQLDGDASDIQINGFSASTASGSGISQGSGRNIIIENGTAIAPTGEIVSLVGQNITLANVSAQGTNQIAVSVSNGLDITIRNVTASSTAASAVRFVNTNDSIVQDVLAFGQNALNIAGNNNRIISSRGYDNSGVGGIAILNGQNTSVEHSIGAVTAGSASGITVSNTVNASIINTSGFATSQPGILIQLNSNNTRIINSTGESSGSNGISITLGNSNLILNSTGRANTSGTGINVATADNTLANVTGTSSSGSGISLSSSGNTLENSSGTSISGSGTTLSGSDHNVTNNTLATATASVTIGALFTSASQTLITNNSLTGNPGIGLRTAGGTNNTIAANIIRGSGIIAVYHPSTTFNNILNNDIFGANGAFQFDSSSTDNTLTQNNINTTTAPGVQIGGSSHRNTLAQNNITAGTSNAVYATTQNNTIVNNTIANPAGASVQIDGTSNPSSGNTIANNSLNSSGSSALILQTTSSAAAMNNTIRVSSSGVGISVTATNSSNISLNQITASTASNGIHVQSGSNSNTIINNTVTGATNGIVMQSGINSFNTFINNTISAIASAVAPTNAYNNTFTNNQFTTSGNQVLNMVTAGGNSLANNTFTAGLSRVMLLQSNVENNTFDNNTLNIGSATLWFEVTAVMTNNTITNTTFNQTGGNIRLANATLQNSASIALGHLNITANRAFLNSTNLSFLNSSARITLEALLTGTAQQLVDFEDDGTFIPCVSPDCTFVSYNGSTLVFDVAHFTSFTSTDGGVTLTLTKTDSPDPIDVSTNNTLTYTILANVTSGAAHNLTINETYPVNVTFISATPAPTTGNFSWLVGNISNGSTYEINITLNVSTDADNGSILSNTVNATYQNSTGDALFVNVTENTTLSNSVCPLSITTSTTLSANVTCPGTAINIEADNVLLDCAGFNITYGITQLGVGINATGRNNVTISRCNAALGGNITGTLSAILLSGTQNSVIEHSTASANASPSIFLTASSHLNTIRNTSATNFNSAATQIAQSRDNNITNNTFTHTAGGSGLQINIFSHNSNVSNNFMSSVSGTSFRLDNSNNNTFEYNRMTNVAGSGFSINSANNTVILNNVTVASTSVGQFTNARNNTVLYNRFTSTSGNGLTLDGASNMNLSHNIISSDGIALTIDLAANNTVHNNSIFGNIGIDIFLSNTNYTISNNTLLGRVFSIRLATTTQNNTFTDNILETNSTWISTDATSSNNTFTNTTFRQTNGSITITPNVTMPVTTTVTLARLNTTRNRAFLNTALLSFLNTSARIQLNSLALTSPNATVDYNDDGLYEFCTPPQCTFESFDGSTLVYNVASFTSYSSSGNVSLDKTDTPDPVARGSTLNYTITVTNTGTDTIGNTTVTETYPAGVSFVTSSPLPSLGNNTFSLGTLAGGANTTINITLSVGSNLANGTLLNNTINLTFSNGLGQNVTLSDNETTAVIGAAQIFTSKTDTPDPVAKGTTLNYTITITNNGDEFAYNTTVLEGYPSGTLFVSASPAPSSGNDTFALGTLAPGASTTINITVNVSASVANGSILNNTYNVTFANPSGQNTTVTNSTTTTVLGLPVLVSIKSDTPDPVIAGTTLNYTILLNNTGDDTAFNVTLSEVYPAGVSFATAQPMPAGNSTFAIGTLAPNQSFLVNITVTVGSNVPNGTILTNNVNASFRNSAGTQGNASGSETTTVIGTAALTVTKTDTPDPATNGSQVTYTITITNTGGEIAYNTTAVEGYPANTAFHNSSPAPTLGNNTFAVGNLSAGASITINITLNISTTFNGTLNNTVNITFANFSGQTATQTANSSTTVNVLTPPAPGGGQGGGSGGGGGGGLGIAQTFSFAQQTLTQNVRALDRITFMVDDEVHTLTVLQVTTTDATIEVQSTPQRFTITRGQTLQIDANQDGTNDITVRLEGITYPRATITLARTPQQPRAQIPAPLPVPEILSSRAIEQPPATNTEPAASAATLPIPPAPSPFAREPTDLRVYIALAAAVLLFALIAVMLTRKTRTKKSSSWFVVRRTATDGREERKTAEQAQEKTEPSLLSHWLAERAKKQKARARQKEKEREQAEEERAQEEAKARAEERARKHAEERAAKQREKEAAEQKAKEAREARARKPLFGFLKRKPAPSIDARDKKLERDMDKLSREMRDIEKLLKRK